MSALINATETTETFVSLGDLVRRIGCEASTIRRRLRLAGRTLYFDPFDQRRRLVRHEDAAWLLTPQPVDDEGDPLHAA
jgi:hypothetical protein